jgi:hypothetical protein
VKEQFTRTAREGLLLILTLPGQAALGQVSSLPDLCFLSFKEGEQSTLPSACTEQALRDNSRR